MFVGDEVKYPKVSWLTVNRGCNNKCIWCYAQNAIKDTMNIDFAKKCVQNLNNLGIKNIVLIGGEPTIYPHLTELIKYIRNNGMKVSLVSNGRRFSDYSFAKECIEAGVSGIDISLKALNKIEYINNTCVDGFEEVIAGYRNLLKLKFRPTLSYVICNNDMNKIIELSDFLRIYELDDITLQFVKPVVAEKSNNILSIDKMGKLVTLIYKIMEESKKNYRIEASIPLCLIEEKVRNDLIHKRKILTCCHIQKGSGLVLDTKFRILPCNHFVDMPYSEMAIGLCEANKICEFWNSESVNEIRRKTLYYPSFECERCKLWDICGGGCFTRWLFEKPSDYICGWG